MSQHGEGTAPGVSSRASAFNTANPLAFLVLVVYGALWYVLKPETLSGTKWGASRYPSHPRET